VKLPQKDKQSGLKRPKHLSLVDIAYQALVEAIVDQVFAPGMQVNIDMLARELNMSNTPVREALMRVMGEGLVEQKTNKGFIVTNFLKQAELRNMFAVRHLLETHALRTGKIIANDIEELDHLATQMNVANDGLVYQDFKDFLQADHEFHHKIVALSNNEFLIRSWENLNVHLHLSRLYTGFGLFDRSDSSQEHINIVQALKKNDQEQAVILLTNHIKDVGMRLVAFLDSRDNNKA
jgi:DNA-binding GntR family transcriptional regulator